MTTRSALTFRFAAFLRLPIPATPHARTLVAIWPGRFVPEMKNLSEDKFELKSPLTEKEIYDRLQKRTLKKRWLSMSWTNKELIGHVDSESFSVISSSFPFPYGAACVVNGKVKPMSEITLTTTLHKAFRILFLVWLIFMTVGLIFTWFSESGGLVGAFWILFGMGIVGFILRLYLHGMYLWARRDVMKKLKRILEIG